MWWLVLSCTTSTEETGGAVAPEWLPMAQPDAWTLVAAADDPFADRPAEVACSELGYAVEGAAFEVNTEDCAYGTFRQPLQVSVSQGEAIEIVFWHLDLWAEDSAKGHIAISHPDGVLHEQEIDIPAGAEVYPVELNAGWNMTAGDWIYFHVHNHGFNSWSLSTVEAFTTP